MAMEVKDMLFMNKGDGENSYVKSSGYTQTVADITQPIVYNAAQSFIRENGSSQFGVLNVADLGCAAGPNTFTVMSTVIESTVKNCSELGFQIPEIQFYLNDLVGNDFNTLFKGLSVIHEKYKNVVSCFAMGAPGSFHGRLFPKNSIHLLHSSYSLHWLSKVPKLTNEEGLPLNKGKLYISETSPPAVSKAYLTQFQQDFLSFLKDRSSEMVCNGRMVLIIQGRQTKDPWDKDACYVWQVLTDAISYMVSQGLIDEEKLDSFNVPYYIASKDEVEDLVKKEDSFMTEFIDLIAIKTIDMIRSTSESRARNFRAFTEPMISYQFGQEVMDKLYAKVKETIVEDSKHGKESTISIVLVLKKIK